MKKESAAFSTPIQQGLIRILLKIESIECEFENDAPDFVNAKNDNPNLVITPEIDVSGATDAFLKSYPLELNDRKSKDDQLLVWELKQEGIWFDIEMDAVKDIWLTDFSFQIESTKPRYLTYYIQNLEHQVEWLQTDEKTGEIRSLSNFKKEFKPPKISERDTYKGGDILKCCDMLARAIRAIDMRTGSALIKFNTEKGRLEPLLIGMGEKLGYHIKPLDKETIRKMEDNDEMVSHSISLK